MITKCQHCPQELEIRSEDVGSIATCPGCGMETELRAKVAVAQEAPRGANLGGVRRRAWQLAMALVAFVVLCLVFVGGAHLLSSMEEDVVMGFLGIAGVLVAFVLVVAWCVMPVVMWWYLSRIDQRLWETNKRLEDLKEAVRVPADALR